MDLPRWRCVDSMKYNDKGLPPLDLKDILGRSIFSKTRAKRAAGRGVDHHAFLEAEGVTTISVDRLDHVSDETMAAIGDDVALERSKRSGHRQSFYGWATVTVQEASERRRLVHYTPTQGNIFHADIDLNIPVCLTLEMLRRSMQTSWLPSRSGVLVPRTNLAQFERFCSIAPAEMSVRMPTGGPISTAIGHWRRGSLDDPADSCLVASAGRRRPLNRLPLRRTRCDLPRPQDVFVGQWLSRQLQTHRRRPAVSANADEVRNSAKHGKVLAEHGEVVRLLAVPDGAPTAGCFQQSFEGVCETLGHLEDVVDMGDARPEIRGRLGVRAQGVVRRHPLPA